MGTFTYAVHKVVKVSEIRVNAKTGITLLTDNVLNMLLDDTLLSNHTKYSPNLFLNIGVVYVRYNNIWGIN
jgi:hypothetical protein